MFSAVDAQRCKVGTTARGEVANKLRACLETPHSLQTFDKQRQEAFPRLPSIATLGAALTDMLV